MAKRPVAAHSSLLAGLDAPKLSSRSGVTVVQCFRFPVWQTDQIFDLQVACRMVRVALNFAVFAQGAVRAKALGRAVLRGGGECSTGGQGREPRV